MATLATLTISIDRSGMAGAPGPLVFSGQDDGTTWGILPGFTMPGAIPTVRYAASPFQHGAVPLGFKYQQAVLSWDAAPDVADGTELAAAEAEVRAALARLSYPVTVDLNGASSVWTCSPGSIVPQGLDLNEAEENKPVYGISIPCYPVAG